MSGARGKDGALSDLYPRFGTASAAFGDIAQDAPEVALWRPFGERRVIDYSGDAADPWSGRAVEWTVVSQSMLNNALPEPMEAWAERAHETVVSTQKIILRVSAGPETRHVLRRKSRQDTR